MINGITPICPVLPEHALVYSFSALLISNKNIPWGSAGRGQVLSKILLILTACADAGGPDTFIFRAVCLAWFFCLKGVDFGTALVMGLADMPREKNGIRLPRWCLGLFSGKCLKSSSGGRKAGRRDIFRFAASSAGSSSYWLCVLNVCVKNRKSR